MKQQLAAVHQLRTDLQRKDSVIQARREKLHEKWLPLMDALTHSEPILWGGKHQTIERRTLNAAE